MIVILLGPSGAGKGTQAKAIVNEFNILHISTGDIFRRNIEEETEVGKKVKKYLDDGMLVPNSLTIEIVKNRISQDDCKNGFLLDGFPRTIEQADAFNVLLSEMGQKLDYVVNLDIDLELLIERTAGRRVCPNCGSSYHVIHNKPKSENICDECGGELFQRKDDVKDNVINRLDIYTKQTRPLIEYYTNKRVILNINGDQPIDKVKEDIISELRGE
jgi:adenylate kinase